MIKLITVLFLLSCQSKNNAIVNVDSTPQQGIILNKWQVFGPFLSNGKEEFLNEDNLKDFSFREAKITYDEFMALSNDNHTTPDNNLTNQYVTYNDKPELRFGKIYKDAYKSESITGNAYAGCILKCNKPMKLMLNFSSDDGAKVWLNNKHIFTLIHERAITPYERYIPLNLNKGDNFLLVKVNNNGDGWDMFAALELENKEGYRRTEQAFKEANDYDFINDIIIKNNKISIIKPFPDAKYEIVISNKNKVVFVDSITKPSIWNKNIASFDNGLYHIALKKDKLLYEQYFFKGNLVDSTKSIIQKLANFKMTNEVNNNVNAAVYRYNYLVKVGTNATGQHGWDTKMAILFSHLDFVLNQLKAKKEPYKNSTVSSIRSYISKIDSSVQYYTLHVPKAYTNRSSLALAFVMPTNLSRKTPYLESQRVANARMFQTYESLANKYNLAIVELHGRTFERHNYNSIEETDFFEVLLSIKQNYSIDRRKIYLTGFCMGSWGALKLATKYPDMFAAVSLNAPKTIFDRANANWVNNNEPLQYIGNLVNLPILVIHSVLDNHTPFKEGIRLNNEAKKTNLKNFQFNKLNASLNYFSTEEFEWYDKSFAFLGSKKLQTSPSKVYLNTKQIKYNKSWWLKLNAINSPNKAIICAKIENNIITIKRDNVISYSIDLKLLSFNRTKPLIVFDNGKKFLVDYKDSKKFNLGTELLKNNPIRKNSVIDGPLSHVFTQKFIVVVGTKGNKNEDKKLSILADRINKLWDDRYLSNCITKSDININLEDIKSANLVLLGNSTSNQVIERIVHQLPIKITDSLITVGKREILGNRLGYYMIYPNPLNKNKYVALIGYNNYNYISLGFENYQNSFFKDISNYGWFDYKIWNNTFPYDTKTSGYFNYKWE